MAAVRVAQLDQAGDCNNNNNNKKNDNNTLYIYIYIYTHITLRYIILHMPAVIGTAAVRVAQLDQAGRGREVRHGASQYEYV